MEELERALLLKLKKLTDRSELFWHFTGETNKICVAFYRDARLKLFPTKLEINDSNGDMIVLDVLVSEALEAEFEQLLQAARKSAGHYPTSENKAVSRNMVDLYKKLLED